uniref:F-box domain-containing protein n=1 Tax=Parascaris equorum TaxID=6256 RepID=A0A914R2Y2_PAREQ
MDQIPSEVLRNILERLPESERIPASFTCRRWLSLLSRSYPRTLEIRINLDASSCNAKFSYSTTCETHVTICSCATHAREHALLLLLLRAMYMDIFYQEGVQCHLEDLTFHSVLRNAPSSISALHIRGVDLSKVHAWTLALIAKFACLEEISLCGCILPIGNESMLSRLIAPSFHLLTSISVTESNQISDKFVTTIARRCPLLRDVNVSGCERVTALSLIAFCECAASRRTEFTSINMCSTSFDFNMPIHLRYDDFQLERYLCSPLLVGGNYWVATPMKIEIAYERAAVCLENTRFRSLLIIAYV